MPIKTLEDLLAEGVSGRGVLVRSDLNVPLDDDRNISDPGRIIASVPTLKALSDAGAKVVVTAHLGRPKDGPDPKFSSRYSAQFIPCSYQPSFFGFRTCLLPTDTMCSSQTYPASKASAGSPAQPARMLAIATLRWAWFADSPVRLILNVRDAQDVEDLAFAVAARILGRYFVPDQKHNSR